MPIAAYRIVTPRLVLRCYSPADVPLLERAITGSLDSLRPWMPWAAAEPEPLEARVERLRRMRSRFDRDEEYVYGIFNPRQDELLGGCGLHPRLGADALEIGYWVHTAQTSRGYATEASAALTRVAFEFLQVTRVEIHCSVENLASAAVPRKLGYTCEATLRQRSFAHGQPSDQLVWSLFAGEYPGSPSSKMEIAAFDAAERRMP